MDKEENRCWGREGEGKEKMTGPFKIDAGNSVDGWRLTQIFLFLLQTAVVLLSDLFRLLFSFSQSNTARFSAAYSFDPSGFRLLFCSGLAGYSASSISLCPFLGHGCVCVCVYREGEGNTGSLLLKGCPTFTILRGSHKGELSAAL